MRNAKLNAGSGTGEPITLARDEVVRLETHVRAQLKGRVRHFRIDVSESGLVLSGRVPNFYVKCLAQHAVMERTRIPIERNRIEVTNSSEVPISCGT